MPSTTTVGAGVIVGLGMIVPFALDVGQYSSRTRSPSMTQPVYYQDFISIEIPS